jgi:hypothetical protein
MVQGYGAAEPEVTFPIPSRAAHAAVAPGDAWSWTPATTARSLPDTQLLYRELYGALELLRGLDEMGAVQRRVAAWRFGRELDQLTPLTLPEGELDWATRRLRDGLWEAQESWQRATSRVDGCRRAASALMTAMVAATSHELSRLEQKLGLGSQLSWRARLRGLNCELGRRCQALWRAHRSYAGVQLEQLFGSRRPQLRERLRRLLSFRSRGVRG